LPGGGTDRTDFATVVSKSGKIGPMPKADTEIDLLTDVVPADRLDPRFVFLRDSLQEEPARHMIRETFRDFEDPDGNFIEQFQTSALDARTFELYLNTYFCRSGYTISRSQPNPDFIVSLDGVVCAVEATTANPRPGEKIVPIHERRELSPEEALQRVEHELPIRFGSPLFSKLKKRYWELRHCRDLPFVIAVEAFHDADSLFFSNSPLGNYLYGLKSFPRWTEEGELYLEHSEIKQHLHDGKLIPSHFFGYPDTEHVSGILFTNSGTISKFGRMGYQAGYHRGNGSMIRRGVAFNHDRNSAVPQEFLYDLDFPPVEETWGQGLVFFHNPNALHPLPRHFFQEATAVYFEDETTPADVPATFVPITSMTIISCADNDSELEPGKEARPGIKSILLTEFESLNPPRKSRTTEISQEKEWYSSDDGAIVGAVVQDLPDKDYFYVLMRRNKNRVLETDDASDFREDRLEIRRRLLDAMEQALADVQKTGC
jgi:hypothetical protein